MSDKGRMLVISEDIEVILYYLKQSIKSKAKKIVLKVYLFQQEGGMLLE